MTKSIFTNSWFKDRAQPIWEEWLLPLKDEFSTYLELGVAEGQSAIWALENLELDHAYLVDEYKAISTKHDQDTYTRARDNAMHNLEPYLDKITLFELSTRAFFGATYSAHEETHWKVLDGSIDLVYIDANHRGDWAMFDICNTWIKLKDGGVFVFDDLNRRFHHQVAECRLAWLGFMAAFDGHYVPIFLGQRQWICRKVVPKRMRNDAISPME